MSRNFAIVDVKPDFYAKLVKEKDIFFGLDENLEKLKLGETYRITKAVVFDDRIFILLEGFDDLLFPEYCFITNYKPFYKGVTEEDYLRVCKMVEEGLL